MKSRQGRKGTRALRRWRRQEKLKKKITDSPSICLWLIGASVIAGDIVAHAVGSVLAGILMFIVSVLLMYMCWKF